MKKNYKNNKIYRKNSKINWKNRSRNKNNKQSLKITVQINLNIREMKWEINKFQI